MKSIDLAAIDLNLLVAFAALYEERSVSAAAQRLYLGQPAMSAALARLRLLFEDELFVRMGREMQPTRRAIDLAPGILAALQQIQQTLVLPSAVLTIPVALFCPSSWNDVATLRQRLICD
jgi:DNA-binding transcriptional LysR family regulator